MRILILHNTYTEKGGEDTTVANEAELLRANGHDVKVHLFENNASKIGLLLKFFAYPVNISSYFKVKKIVKEYKPDVVHIHNYFFTISPLGLWAIKSTGVPLVATVQNFRLLCPSYTLYHNNHIYLKALSKEFTLQPALDKVYRNSFFLTFWVIVSNYFHLKIGSFGIPAKYIFVSNFSKNIFEHSRLAKYKDKFVLKYNFMMDDNSSPNPARQDYFLFVGRLTQEKGISTLLDSFKGSNVTLKIVGDGPMKDEVVACAAQHNNIHYLGFKGKTEILELLTNAKALVFPSVWYEGMPLTIIEAFSVGTPVIASNLGAMSEMIIPGVNGLHFTAATPTDLTEKVNELNNYTTDELAKLIYSTRADFSKRFSDKENIKALIGIYQSAQ